MKKTALTLSLLATTALIAVPQQAQAADIEMQSVLEDTLYGAAIGGLIGAGMMLISSHPTKHWNYISTGAGVGLIAGAVYGTAKSAGALATLDEKGLHLGMPAPQLALRQSESGSELAMQTNLFASRF